ncbi:protein phosphatase 2C domain-containing protein [Alkaliphilus sp. MSJ-5]|uniref:Protein phosphatase 2C domain-containing protein n=1 Tax=Alkaliphilus flagellatus TaxID=2841507 RepID=A0ABS6G6R1_9FIRM|nr:protein phosphatase 2C domain-containing protein [Alkaliphilus flagellatus]MBU5677846.1 protein phosphatase 2C domain-containing protein [Alkaliphilus flagellatus]
MREFMFKNKYTVTAILFSIVGLLILIRNYMDSKLKRGTYCNGLEVGVASSIGNREYQEDAMDIASFKKATLAVLADGIGKKRAGQLSSRLVVKIFVDLFTANPSIDNINYFFKRAFNITNREILKTLEDHQGGASVACGIIVDGLLHYALVGNTMVAVFRNNELIPLSEGHTVNILAQKGFYQGKISRQDALWALKEKRLFNYVGQDGFKDIEIYDVPVKLKSEDIVLLMSDGIHSYLPWNQLEEVLKKDLTCDEMATAIIKKLKETSITEKDNASILLIRYK